MTLEEAIKNAEHRNEWLREFQKYCNSDEVRDESEKNGINACGYGIQCDMCRDSAHRLACALSMDDYCFKKGKQIDYQDKSVQYFRKLLRGEA